MEHPTGGQRTRDLSWGDARARALMHALARDAAARTGFSVCAIEVVRPRGLLEFVAIHGDAFHAEQRLGTASRLADMQLAFADGETHGSFIWIPEESFSEATLDRITGVVVVPDVPPSEAPDDWRAMDMLVALVHDERGDLRALLYLDVPVDLKRPDKDRLQGLTDELDMTLRSIVTVVEREEYVEHMRVIRATRRLARSAPARHDVGYLLREARTTLLGALSVDELEIHLVEGEHQTPDILGIADAPDVREALDRATARCWVQQGVLVIEKEHIWGDAALAAGLTDWFRAALDRAGLDSVVVAPVGVDDDVLGSLLLAREEGARRWTDSEGVAALELGHDLGRAIANAHATERERRLLRELRDLEESRHRFLRTLTHEINNPMTVIAANTEFLLDSADATGRDRRRAQAIMRGTERLGELLDGLSVLTRVTDPHQPPEMAELDLVAVVEEALLTMAAIAERAGVTIDVAVAPSGAPVLGDQREVLRAVTNLLDNAVKYSDRGGEIWLQVRRTTAGGATFECRDEGIGISEADQADLFTPLFRSSNDEALRRPGTGLGLGIVREIMQRHGGSIDVESALGRGTRVTLHFPPAG